MFFANILLLSISSWFITFLCHFDYAAMYYITKLITSFMSPGALFFLFIFCYIMLIKSFIRSGLRLM